MMVTVIEGVMILFPFEVEDKESNGSENDGGGEERKKEDSEPDRFRITVRAVDDCGSRCTQVRQDSSSIARQGGRECELCFRRSSIIAGRHFHSVPGIDCQIVDQVLRCVAADRG